MSLHLCRVTREAGAQCLHEESPCNFQLYRVVLTVSLVCASNRLVEVAISQWDICSSKAVFQLTKKTLSHMYIPSLILFLFLLNRRWRNRKRRSHKSVLVVDFPVLAEQLLLASLIVPVSSDLVAVFFGLEERGDVDAGPDSFAAELALDLLALLECSRRFRKAVVRSRTCSRACP